MEEHTEMRFWDAKEADDLVMAMIETCPDAHAWPEYNMRQLTPELAMIIKGVNEADLNALGRRLGHELSQIIDDAIARGEVPKE